MKKQYLTLVIFLLLALSQVAQAQIIGDSSACAGESAVYSTPLINGASYAWNVTGGNILGNSNGNSLTVSWPLAGSASVMVTVYLPNNSQLNYYLAVVIHPLPQPIITHEPYPGCPSDPRDHSGAGSPDQGGQNDCEKVCKYATITYSTALNPGSSYLWTAGGASAITGFTTNTVSVSWDSSPYGYLIVYETNQFGCTDSASICIEKVDLPVALFSHQLNVCKFSPVNFLNQSSGATSFQWYFGDGGNSTLTNPSHAYSNAGTYVITLIAMNDCFCADTFQSTIQVDSLPGPEISCPSTVCAFDTATYSTSVPGCVYTWVVSGGSILGPANQQSVTVIWGAGQMGVLGLSVSGCTSTCSDTTWLYIPIIPANGSISGPNKVCPGECATYSLPKFSGAVYNWSLNSSSCGAIQDSSCCEEIVICWPGNVFFCTDTLTVSYWDNFLNCGGSATLLIRVRPELSIFGQQEGCSNGTSAFYAFGSINSNWAISPPGPALSPGPAPALNVNWSGFTGNYRITAYPVNPNQTCNDSASILVKVINPPAAPVITGDTLVCPNTTVQYCATGSGNIQWLITGGTPANGGGNCITVSWGNTPPFLVQAYTQMPGSPFCSSDTSALVIVVPINPPVPVFSGSHLACANATSLFSTPTPYPNGTTFTWALTPANAGTILTGQGQPNIQVEWGNNAPQTVVLGLSVELCGITISDTFHIQLNAAPLPLIVQTGNLCPGNAALLNATGGIFSTFQWSGPGGFSSVLNPVSITQEGLYQLTVTDAGGCSGLTQLIVHYSGTPVASISAQDPTSYCIGSAYSVTLCALGNPNYSYAWSNAATSQCVTLNSQGSFQVTVTDNSNSCFAVSNIITILEDSCIPDTNQCIPAGSVSFTHASCNPRVFTNTSVNAGSFYWNFGDGWSSNLSNPTHTYNNAGFFLVTLYGYVPDASGTDSCLVADTALIEIPLLPRFTFASGCFGDSSCFTDNSVFTAGNNITSWYWDFGDGNNTTVQHPCHLYGTSGTFIVTLTISNGSCTTSWSDTLVVLPQPNAAFSFNPNNCANTPLLFSDLSTTNINYWNWDFGNAGSSLNQNPSQSYNPAGTYLVTLIVHDIYGCYDTLVNPLLVNSNLLSGNISAAPDSIVCAGNPVTLSAPACPGCTFLWSNGAVTDSIVVTSSGFYGLTMTDPNGCTHSSNIRVIVNQLPFAVITGPNQACLGENLSLNVPYNVNYLYSWISNDTNVNGQSSPTVWLSATSPGLFFYSVLLTDTVTGCSDTTALHLLSVHLPPPPPLITPLGATVVCQGDSVLLVMSHPDSSVMLQWSTGAVSDTLVVTEDGCYDAIATNLFGCSSLSTFCVTVNKLPDLCSFYEGCFDTCVPYTIAGPAGGSSYQWLLNGVPISGADSQYYVATVSGSYSLIVTNSFGCVDTTGLLNLNLYPCPGDGCVDFIVDSVYCDSVSGQYILDFHVINQSNIIFTEIHLQILPPNLGVGYFPGAFIQTVLPGDTSTQLSTTLFNGNPGDTLCFRTNIFTYDAVGIEILVCASDTLCFVLPDCGNDTSCCQFTFISDSIWCLTSATGAPEYHFNFLVDGCGTLDIQLLSQGNISLNNPYVLNGGQTLISGVYYPVTGGTLCLLFMVHDSLVYCADTTICFTLPPCSPPVLPCEWAFNHYICAGTATVFQHYYFVPGTTYLWQFPGGIPSAATGMGPHAVQYNTAGIYPVQLSMVHPLGTVICLDTIHVLPGPSASISQSGYSLIAAPSGLQYQWYNYPVSQATLLGGATNQFFNPASGGTYCVVVQNDLGCADTACIDFIYEDPCDSLHALFSVNTIWLTGQFLDQSTAGSPLVITGWQWNFGDPASGAANTAYGPNPVHHFTATGYYLVCLKITAIVEGTDIVCQDSICMEIYVKRRPKIIGHVIYLNGASSPLSNTLVVLTSGQDTVAVDTTNTIGQYQFDDLDPGVYSLHAVPAKPWGGVNATDALMILKHFVGISSLQGLTLKAASVDANPVVNSVDALIVSRRFTGMISSFATGDWVSEHNTLDFDGDSMHQPIRVLCYGDVNNSYVPPALRTMPELQLAAGTPVYTNEEGYCHLPLSFTEPLDLAALSLVLHYPAASIEITGLSTTHDPEHLLYHVNGDELRVAWFTLSPKSLQAHEPFIDLEVRILDKTLTTIPAHHFQVGFESSLADFEGTALLGKSLLIPDILVGSKAFILDQNVPNPSTGLTTIHWYQPVEGQIKLSLHDLLGREVKRIFEGETKAGSHETRLDLNGLPEGVYVYRVLYQQGASVVTQSHRLIYRR